MQGPLLHFLFLVAIYYGTVKAAPTILPRDANLPAELAAATPNQEFVLSPGDYTITALIILSVNVSITGNNSAIICNTNEITGLSVIGGQLILDTITLTGCSSAVSAHSPGPHLFRNCQFTNNTNGIVSNVSVDVTNCTFLRNSCAMRIENGSARIELSTFADNIAQDDFAGAVTARNAAVAISNTTLYGNAGANGGAIYADNGPLNLTYVTAYDNSAINGGVVYVSRGTPTFRWLNFTDNVANANGGAVYVSTQQTFTCFLGDFVNNSAGSGGGMYILNAGSLLLALNFERNVARANGGGLYASSRQAAHLTQSTFSFNTAVYGGGLYTRDSLLATLHTDFYGNTASSSGGGVFGQETLFAMNVGIAQDNRANAGGFATLVLSQSNIFRVNISRNFATSDGGAFFIDRAFDGATFDDFVFDNNTAQGGSGGAIFATRSVVRLIRINMMNQRAAVRGGGVYLASGNFTSESFVATSNYATISGGALALVGVANASLVSTHFISNSVGNTHGGAVYISGGVVEFADVEFVANSAIVSGGAVYVDAGTTAQFRTSAFTGNLAVNGGAVSAFQSNISLVSSSMVRNKATGQGGALQSLQNPSLYISDCTILENEAESAGGVFVETSRVEITFSKIVNNSANFGGGIYVQNVNFLSLLANNNIEGNRANNFSGIYIASDNNLLHIRNTLVSTVSPGLIFCCNGNRLLNPAGAVCNYPTCDTQCREASGCTCPFTSPPLLIASPVLSRSSSNCTCLSGNGSLCITNKPCPYGYQLSQGACLDVNECLAPNACDSRVTNCTNTDGSYACGSCPIGFTGDARAACRTLCGDGICDATQGENCVSCTADCKQNSCGQCGDGVCEANESCSSCYEDCGACQISTCKNGCSGHGTCVSGVCQCTGSWTGPTCNTNNQPVDFETNKTTPSAGGSVRTVLFSIAVRSLIERDASGAIVAQFGLDAREHNFTFLETSLFGSSANTVWVYSIVLSNSAVVNVTFISFEEDSTQYTFANQTSSYPANTLKVNLRVSQWPFQSISNTLQVGMETDARENKESGCVPVTTSSADSQGNLLWVKVTVNSVAFYGQFVPYSVVDGRTRNVQFSLHSDDKMVYATLPHFWNSAEFDPSYTVLIDSSDRTASCGKKDNTTLIIAVVVSVVGVIILVGAVVLFISWRQRKRTTDQLEMKLRRANSTLSNSN